MTKNLAHIAHVNSSIMDEEALVKTPFLHVEDQFISNEFDMMLYMDSTHLKEIVYES